MIDPSTVLFFPPSEASTMMFDVPETPLTMTFGLQPSRFAKTYAWIANVGVAKIARTFAPGLQPRDLRADVRRGHLVRLRGDDLRP